MRIEIGKFYRARNGEVFGPFQAVTDMKVEWAAPAENGMVLFWKNPKGRWLCDGYDHVLDLVEEVEEMPEDESEIQQNDGSPYDHDYGELQMVLDMAFEQASEGKGKDRHANGKNFIKQPIMEIGRMVGPGFNTGQAMKKLQEATRMIQRGELDAAKAELLGAINYAAATVLLIMET